MLVTHSHELNRHHVLILDKGSADPFGDILHLSLISNFCSCAWSQLSGRPLSKKLYYEFHHSVGKDKTFWIICSSRPTKLFIPRLQNKSFEGRSHSHAGLIPRSFIFEQMTILGTQGNTAAFPGRLLRQSSAPHVDAEADMRYSRILSTAARRVVKRLLCAPTLAYDSAVHRMYIFDVVYKTDL